ncbi:hypothetical protein [Streptomyces sp. NPDC021969]|uniref:hypothetical protein n=1 Tax=unclassified Streptomyces TaxID=2593676 RepID=UPI0033CB0E43
MITRARHGNPELVGALTGFFRTHGHLDPPPGLADRRAAARRARRIEAPAPLRSQVTGFAGFLLLQRGQDQQPGLRPNQLKTLEIRLDAVRDLAIHLHAEGHTSWAGATTGHLESFLALTPARRASRLAGLRQFVAYVHRA